MHEIVLSNHLFEKIVIKILQRDNYKCISFQPYILKKDIWVESKRGFVIAENQLMELQEAIKSILNKGGCDD